MLAFPLANVPLPAMVETMLKNPVHPGAILREDVVAALGISASEAARWLKVPAPSLRRVLDEAAPIDADLAVKLERAGISTAQTLLTLQAQYNLARARQRTSGDSPK